MRCSLPILLALTASVSVAWADPCRGINRRLGLQRRADLAVAIAKQQRVPTVDVLQSFRSGSWSILYVANHVTDEPFLFYSGNPLRTPPVTAWAGAAAADEEESVKRWALKNAPGIPQPLARCFAWHVTQDRDR